MVATCSARRKPLGPAPRVSITPHDEKRMPDGELAPRRRPSVPSIFSGLDFPAYFDLPCLLAALAFCVSYLYLCLPRRPLELLQLLLLTVLTRLGLQYSWLHPIFDFLFFFNSVPLIFVCSLTLSSSIAFVLSHPLSRINFGWRAF